MEHSSFERFAELCDVKIDLYASDFSSLSAMDLFVVVEAALLTFPGADELPLSPREKGIESNIHFSNCEQLLRLFFFFSYVYRHGVHTFFHSYHKNIL